jgi:4-diphosphocytidyl-2-C-methyl-D-erythritol kinase
MDLRRDDLKRIAHAPAKLNLYLDLLGRRADGFHEVETLMVPIRLYDSVSFVPIRRVAGETAGIQLDVRVCEPLPTASNCADIPTGANNLVVRALELLRQQSGCELGAKVELVKRIPSEAGLGGGSSDAATALKLGNIGWGLNWPVSRIAKVAAEIGSDVPFFLYGGAAVCRGRGEIIESLPAVAPTHFVVVKPPVGLNTGKVYQAMGKFADSPDRGTQSNGGLKEIVPALRSGSAGSFGQWMWNGLQQAASSLSPWVGKLRATFRELDFVGHQLSGSGTAYFGVCRHAQHARRLANILRTRQLGLVYATRSCQ